MYDAAGAWGGTNPFPGPLVVLTHHPEDQPGPGARLRVRGRPRRRAGPGAASSRPAVRSHWAAERTLIRQGLAAGVVDELAVSTAPVVLGAGKRLFEGFEHDLDARDPRRAALVVRRARAVRRASVESHA